MRSLAGSNNGLLAMQTKIKGENIDGTKNH
jgi:hypothetical protein